MGDSVWVTDSKDLLEPWVEGLVLAVVKEKKMCGGIKWRVTTYQGRQSCVCVREADSLLEGGYLLTVCGNPLCCYV